LDERSVGFDLGAIGRGSAACFFNKIKRYRAIATRYNKLARRVLATVQLVAAIILLN
jgi:transposase